MKLVLFYHLTQINHWRQITAEVFSSAAQVPFADIRVTMLGTEPLLELPANARVVRRSAWTSWNEFACLDLIHEYSVRHPGEAVCYLHSKGVLWPNSPEKEQRDEWRRNMLAALCGRWNDCVRRLENGADTVGCWWVSRSYKKDISLPGSEALRDKQYYPGNFWWARTDYISRLPGPGSMDPRNRFPAEGWLCDARGKFARII